MQQNCMVKQYNKTMIKIHEQRWVDDSCRSVALRSEKVGIGDRSPIPTFSDQRATDLQVPVG